jgi:peptide deformylase
VLKLPAPIGGLRIVFYPAPILRRRCEAVEEFDDSLVALVSRMEELLFESNGVGLAAPQVGIAIRLFICNPTCSPGDTTVWVNPELSELEGLVESEEGCLSIPGVSVPKRRAMKATICGQGLDGAEKRVEGEDLVARIWQHERDHLDGVLVVDGMSESAELANRRAVRQLEEEYAAANRR